MSDAEPQTAKSCTRCKANPAPYELRNAPTCRKCYAEYVEGKVGRRLGILNRENRTSSRPEPRRYLGGLSFGASSAFMTRVLDATARFHASNKGSAPLEPHLVHVDTDLSRRQHTWVESPESPAQRLLARYRARFPNVSVECVHLSRVVQVRTVDWAVLPGASAPGTAEDEDNDMERLRRLFEALPSETARRDILRLLIRHLLLHMAMKGGYSALLLGHNTTALAALTLAEVANGRGFSVPSQVNDGEQTICTYETHSNGTDTSTTTPPLRQPCRETSRTEFKVYYPLREVFKVEVKTYLGLDPSLAELVPADDTAARSSVVSHKDISIEEVMGRYFESVEGPYSSVVANVVRTAGKLDGMDGRDFCRLCGMTLDDLGDSRWAGELGEVDGEEAETNGQASKLCYGCKRSIYG